MLRACPCYNFLKFPLDSRNLPDEIAFTTTACCFGLFCTAALAVHSRSLKYWCLTVQFDLEGEPPKPLWKTWRFWWILITTTLAFGWLFAGIALAVTMPTKIVVVFQAWRWCIFFAGIMPIFWVSSFLIWLLVLVVEATLFRQWMALYFLAGTKVGLAQFPAGSSLQCKFCRLAPGCVNVREFCLLQACISAEVWHCL